MIQREILLRVLHDPKYYKKDEIILGIRERDGSTKYIEFKDLDVKGGWLYKNGKPYVPLHRVIEIRTKDGYIIWKRSP